MPFHFGLESEGTLRRNLLPRLDSLEHPDHVSFFVPQLDRTRLECARSSLNKHHLACSPIMDSRKRYAQGVRVRCCKHADDGEHFWLQQSIRVRHGYSEAHGTSCRIKHVADIGDDAADDR